MIRPTIPGASDTPSRSQPLVSVIVPSYNHGRYIERTIESIKAQSYQSIELIVIDDRSSDDSAARLQAMAGSLKFRLVLKSRNQGLVRTLNDGLSLAQGKYFAPCASDDYWHPEKLALQVQRMETEPDLKFIFTEGMEVDVRGEIVQPVRYTHRHRERWYFDDVLLKADLPPASFLARRLDMLQVGGYSEAYRIEDLPMWLALLAGGGYCAVIKQPLAYYRSHGSNMHDVFSSMVVDEHYKIVQHFSLNHPRRSSILAEWQLRNGNFLAGIDKRKSMLYLIKAITHLNDYRLYAGIYKNIVGRRP
jgi:alpha-1,3-rhamnosyltransferase